MYQISEILKAIARDKDLHEGFRKNVLLYDAMLPMAKRYIIEESDKVIQQAQIYQKRGYGISLEYMGGEDTVSQEKCRSSVDKTIELIKTIDLNLKVSTVNVCFDLSTIGLVISEQLTLDNLNTIAEVAQEKDIQLILSMEEPKKIDSILKIYKKASSEFKNLGITLQAYLERTINDIKGLKKHRSGRIRLVKGVYGDKGTIPRSRKLNDHYLACLNALLEQGQAVNIATHDSTLLDSITKHHSVFNSNIVFEMLHGVSPPLLCRMKAKGLPSTIYIAFGKEWYVHFLHRLAECPENILLAAEDLYYSRDSAVQHPYF